ncbi:MAG: sugar phosphate isomerase/epimerase [Desulfobacteraceae bacterium]|nr:sugar phosphate isomerase/epimerase [Desulfobacteraceae bacterium]
MPMQKTARSFRLGTTSFIYPDHIVPNVKKLGPDFDEIELLIFESKPIEYLPPKADIDELVRLSQALSVTYNIHLPTDISLSHASKAEREEGIDTVARVMELVAPLAPTTHTLHLDFTDQDREAGEEGIKRWQERVINTLELLAARISDPGLITLETLDYPPDILFPVLDESSMSLCIDAGHLIKYDYDIAALYERYQSRIPLIHFHGVDFSFDPPKDHQGLDKTLMERVTPTLEVLKRFTGVVSLEVFNRDNLTASVAWMERFFS